MSDELGQAVREHGPGLYRIAWRMLGHADDVDDVLQDVFLEALQFSRRAEVSSWVALLKRLTVCRSLDRLRICLRYFDDLSHQQIASTLRISPAAVATALRKARVKLAELLPDEVAKGAKP